MFQAETKKCQNCKKEFTIEPDDFQFYQKIKVPPPTWCPECRLIRRMMFRNERALYKRKCDATGKETISMFSSDKPFKVYEQKYWWSDEWDPMSCGRDYDFSRPFFSQFLDLIRTIPWSSLSNWNSVNSDYCNFTTDNKNCYLVFGGDFNEDCAHSTFNFYSKDSFDLYWVNKIELCYECIDSEGCYKVFFSQYTRNCTESFFLFNCADCHRCFGCVNLRNKSYCIFNKQYSKEEYEEEIKGYDFGNFLNIESLKKKFLDLRLKQPHRYAEIIKSINSTGNNIHNAKNCKYCFDAYENIEDSKDLLIAGWSLRDAFNCDHVGHKAELIYDSLVVFLNSYKVLFSDSIHKSHEIRYCYNISSCSNLFGCTGLKNKQYCILNKQYTKEEYEELVLKIIQHMNEMPYVDKKGRIYKYGEFFPPELSPFCYNETVAQEYFPLSKAEAESKGYSWKDPEERDIKPDVKTEDLPDHIKDVKDDIIGKVIECQHQGKCNEQCTQAFRIIPQELAFYRKMNLPLPRLCPNCRHYQRLKQRNPLKLWHRKCQCGGEKSENGVYKNTIKHFHGDNSCPNEFETTYSPERPEIVYCEKCYLQEVV